MEQSRLRGHSRLGLDPLSEWSLSRTHRHLGRAEDQRLIWLARYPAPNPLSMFTTATPGAQAFIIPRSPATPSKLAPYPTDVGTAMTGPPRRPAPTLGRAPPIPASTTMTYPPRNN